MSYQIKSTPFFRRMLSTSKKNGQLQRLKEEYERMKEFNDRAIEMKMRQVRLKRLFKEIEEIKETTTQQPKRRRTIERARTIDEIRLETLLKAKELGKEYSKMNALLVGSGSKIDNYATTSKSASRIETRKKKLIEKAVNYGNDSSRANMEKLRQTPRKRITLKNEPKSMSAINESQEKLKQRLSYGNSRSSINMTRVPTKRQGKISLLSSGLFKPTENPDMTRMNYEMSSHDIRYIPSNSDLLKCTYEELQRNMMQLTKQVDELSDELPVKKRAANYWRKLALTVMHRFVKPTRHNSSKLKHVDSVQFRLRTTENDTDLTLRDSPSDDYRDAMTSDGFEDHIPNEVLLNVSPLTNSTSWTNPNSVTNTSKTSARTFEIEVLKDPKIGNRKSQHLTLKKTVIPTEKVHKLAKIFEPFVREAAQKEVYDGVRKLNHIFEHQTNTE